MVVAINKKIELGEIKFVVLVNEAALVGC